MKVVVTGGMSGIGNKIVNRFLTDPKTEMFVVDKKIKSGGKDGRITEVGFDLTNLYAIPQLVANIGAIDVLVNNAGIYYGKPVDEYTPEMMAEIMTVNAFAPLELSRHFAYLAHRRRPLRIINITSVVAETSGKDIPYAMSKASLQNQIPGLLKRFGRNHVTINAVAPGIVYGTEMFEQIDEDVREGFRAMTVDGEFTRPVEIAEGVYWLATCDVPGMNGATIHINNGSRIV